MKLAVLLTWLSVVTKIRQLHTPTRRHTRGLHTVTNTGTLIEEQLHIPQQGGTEQQLRVMESIPSLFALVPSLALSLSLTLSVCLQCYYLPDFQSKQLVHAHLNVSKAFKS